MISLIVYENDSEQTLLNFLKKTFKKASLAKIYYLFYEKKIKINQKTVTNFKYQIKENDIIVIYDNMLTIPEKKRTIISDPGAKLLVHYEDDNIIIVNKPHNIMIHSVNLLSLDNMVRYYLQIQAQAQKINLSTFTISHLYRLDKLTLGLVVYPKNRKSQQVLLQAQNLKKIIKYYYAVVSGVYDADN